MEMVTQTELLPCSIIRAMTVGGRFCIGGAGVGGDGDGGCACGGGFCGSGGPGTSMTGLTVTVYRMMM